jgi:peptide/nickel transport system permease protein
MILAIQTRKDTPLRALLSRSPLVRARRLLRRLTADRAAGIGLIIVILYLAIAIIGPMLAPYNFAQVVDDPDKCLTRSNGDVRCAALKNAPPSSDHVLGTDRNGRDMLSRLLYGGRETLGLPAVATFFSVLLGMTLGLYTGYIGGWPDEIISRLIDSLLSIPALILALVTLATLAPSLDMADSPLIDSLGSTNIAIVVVITLLYTPIVARVVRAAALAIRDLGYVEAARLRGESLFYILFREILPGVTSALVVEGALRFSYAIFLVTSLGFLGLGAQPPSPEWGRMVLDARSNYGEAPWTLWVPVVAIALLVIGVNLLSDGLQRVLRGGPDNVA